MDPILLLSIGSIFLAILVLSISSIFFYEKLIKWLESSSRVWDDALLIALFTPLHVAIWLWGLTLAAQFFVPTLITVEQFKWIVKAREIITIFLLAWFLYRFTRRLEINYYKSLDVYSTVLDQTTASAMTKVVKFSIVFITVIILLKYLFNVSLTGLWTLGGAGSIILGFAAKDMLANFFGGFMFFFDKPFSIGDLIRSPDRHMEGFVERIGWRLTQIRTREMSPLYIPNSVFSTVIIENLSHRLYRQINETMAITYQDADKVDEITEEITQMLKEHSDIEESELCYATLNKFSASALEIQIYCYSKEISRIPYFRVKQDIMLKALAIVKKHGAQTTDKFPLDVPVELIMIPPSDID